MQKKKLLVGKLVTGCLFALCLASKLEAQPVPPGGGGGGTNTYDPPPDISNYLKYQAQSFLVLNTNTVASTDTNLFNALSSFSDDNGTNPVLQVMPYENNCLLFKASRFDYSGESARDFCLVVCDKVETPLYKNMDITNPSNNIQNGGWLLQGSVPNWQVSGSMFLMVSNTSRIYNGFFRVIPYGGPQIELSGPQPNDVVSNIVTFQTTITDLSGITNEQLEATVDGQPARYSFGSNNTLNIDTIYNPNGPCNVYLQAANNASVYDLTNILADNAKIFFAGLASMPLDFENATYLASASDYCPTNIGTNYVIFSVDKAQNIEASITDPSNGELVAYFSGSVPYATYVEIPWNFTEADGVTPYTNDAYVVTFTAYDPATITITNHIDRHGVRAGSGCFLTYQWEDPADPTGNYLNNQAYTYIDQTLTTLYQDIYDSLGHTQYDPSVVGANRNHSMCIPYTSYEPGWFYIFSPYLSNSVVYSDLTIAEAHGSGATIGGGPFLPDKFTPLDLQHWILGNQSSGPDWRLRKAALWACYSGDISPGATAGGMYPSFADACGIRAIGLQQHSYMRKNCGLFFGGLLPQGDFGGNSSATTAVVAEFLDQAWVCGQNQYAGGCDPTYSFAWAVNATRGMYNPQLDSANPLLFGLPQMPYSSVYDDELMMLDFSNVKN